MKDVYDPTYPMFLPRVPDHVKAFVREHYLTEIRRAEAAHARKLRQHWFRAVARTRRLRRFGGS